MSHCTCDGPSMDIYRFLLEILNCKNHTGIHIWAPEPFIQCTYLTDPPPPHTHTKLVRCDNGSHYTCICGCLNKNNSCTCKPKYRHLQNYKCLRMFEYTLSWKCPVYVVSMVINCDMMCGHLLFAY